MDKRAMTGLSFTGCLACPIAKASRAVKRNMSSDARVEVGQGTLVSLLDSCTLGKH